MVNITGAPRRIPTCQKTQQQCCDQYVEDVQPVQFRWQEINKIDIAGEELMTDQLFNPLNNRGKLQ